MAHVQLVSVPVLEVLPWHVSLTIVKILGVLAWQRALELHCLDQVGEFSCAVSTIP
jgi:hypothetical protein